MERLLAHPVARQQQRTLPDVPDGEGEHAVEMVHAVFAPRLVCVHEDLGIGPRAKTMSQTLQVSAERQEVVDLAVQGAPDRAGLVGDRRSEEHTSELQSQSNLVCRLLLEKKKEHALY